MLVGYLEARMPFLLVVAYAAVIFGLKNALSG
jgi:hypothetical protein